MVSFTMKVQGVATGTRPDPNNTDVRALVVNLQPDTGQAITSLNFTTDLTATTIAAFPVDGVVPVTVG